MSNEEARSRQQALARMIFEEDLERLMDREDLNRASLAERIETSRAYVTKILNGTTSNYTVATMAKLAIALRAVLQIRLIQPEREVSRVVDLETAAYLDDREAEDRIPTDANLTHVVVSYARFNAHMQAGSLTTLTTNQSTTRASLDFGLTDRDAVRRAIS